MSTQALGYHWCIRVSSSYSDAGVYKISRKLWIRLWFLLFICYCFACWGKLKMKNIINLLLSQCVVWEYNLVHLCTTWIWQELGLPTYFQGCNNTGQGIRTASMAQEKPKKSQGKRVREPWESGMFPKLKMKNVLWFLWGAEKPEWDWRKKNLIYCGTSLVMPPEMTERNWLIKKNQQNNKT